MEVNNGEVVLCEFYFSDLKKSKNRPVLVFKDNLPHNDFVAMPISSKVNKLYTDEMLIDSEDFVDGTLPVSSKIMTRKTFVVSKDSIVKKYGTLDKITYGLVYEKFCKYFDCVK